MKYIIIILTLTLLSTSKALPEEADNCSSLKKFSIQYTWCKSKNATKGLKNKINNLKQNKTGKEQK